MGAKQTEVNYEQRFAALQQRFIATLLSKTDKLQQYVEQISDGEFLRISDLIADSHQLAGSCGTFGFKPLGELAKAIEHEALRLQAVKEPSSASLMQLKALVQHFKHSSLALDHHEVALQNTLSDDLMANNTIWILLDNDDICTELSQQLNAFGYILTYFSSIESCEQLLEKQQPALLFASVYFKDNTASIFTQKNLMQLIQHKHIPLMLFSALDDFDLRVQAARHQAKAFYVSAMDIPAMVGRITQLMNGDTFKKGRICILDDDLLLAEHFALALQSAGIDSLVISDPTQIIQEIVRYQPELILMDLQMPDYSGPELAGVIRQHDALKSLPIVYVSSERDQTQQLKAMAFGADDFLTKPITDTQLVNAVQVRLARSRELRNLIEKDSLTGLLKHSAIKEAAQLEFERAKRNHHDISLVMLDIDHFKQVNDRYGHGIGDVVITTLATILQQRIRRTDKAGRYGGEEFVLVLPDCSRQDAVLMVETILHSFSGIVFHAANEDFNCSFSAGVASSFDGFKDAETMLIKADEKLYNAKSLGRNRVIA